MQNSSNVKAYGDKTCATFQAYTMSVSYKVGHITKTASRVFHITGLPYRINFQNSDDLSWGKLGNAEYSDKRIFFKSAVFSKKQSAIRSPKFYLPKTLTVRTYADASCKRDGETLYAGSCADGANSISFGSAEMTINKNSSFKPSTLQKASDAIELTTSSPALMFAATTPASYGIAVYKVEILYN